jgi:hypothetical protein
MVTPVANSASNQSSAAATMDTTLTPQIEASSPSSSTARQIQNWIVAITLLGTAVVGWLHIHSFSIWYDETVTLLMTSGHPVPDLALGADLFKPTANLPKVIRSLYNFDVHPPVYFLLLSLWRTSFGASIVTARLLSLLFTLGTLLVLYLYAIDLRLRWPSVPVVIYALSAAALRYAYNARPYALVTLLVISTLYLARRRSNWTPLVAAICVATHYFSALLIGSILLVEFLQGWNTARRWVIRTACIFAALCLPVLPFLARQSGARPSQYHGFGMLRKEISALVTGAIAGALPSTTLWPAWHWALFFAALCALVGAVRALRHKQFTLPLAYAMFIAGFLLLAIVTHKSIIQMPRDYYLGIAAPIFSLLLACAVCAFPIALPVLAAILLIGTATSAPMLPTTDYRSITREIRSQCNNCVLLVGNGSGGIIPATVLYDSDDLQVRALMPGDTPQQIALSIGANRPVYFIPSNEPDSASADAEKQFLNAFYSQPHGQFFKVDLSAPKL